MRYLVILSTILFLFSCAPKPENNHIGAPLQVPKPTKEIKKNTRTIQFASKDNLTITADLYQKDGNAEFILLCHQAGFSRGEYIHTAPKLVKMGFNCLAIDQRSGSRANDVINQTAQIAKNRGLPQKYADARQDIEAAIDKAYELNNNHPIILVGSSYSAALSLVIGKSDKVKAVASFSPGEYIKGLEIGNNAKDLTKPVFVTCAKKEIKAVDQLLSQVNKRYLTFYQPTEKGIHGSRALWDNTDGHEGYWKAFQQWILQL